MIFYRCETVPFTVKTKDPRLDLPISSTGPTPSLAKKRHSLEVSHGRFTDHMENQRKASHNDRERYYENNVLDDRKTFDSLSCSAIASCSPSHERESWAIPKALSCRHIPFNLPLPPRLLFRKVPSKIYHLQHRRRRHSSYDPLQALLVHELDPIVCGPIPRPLCWLLKASVFGEDLSSDCRRRH